MLARRLRRLQPALQGAMPSCMASGTVRRFQDFVNPNPTNVLVVWHDEAEEAVALAEAVHGWRCVSHFRMMPRESGERSRRYFGRGQIERLRHRLKLAAQADTSVDMAAEGGPTTSRAWRARTLDKPLASRLIDEIDDGTPDDDLPVGYSQNYLTKHEERDSEDAEEDVSDESHLSAHDIEPWIGESERWLGLSDEAAHFSHRSSRKSGASRDTGQSPPPSFGSGGLVLYVDTPTLKASQLRDLTTELGVPVFDRFSIVLEIFRSRAQSLQARLRVELAALSRQRAHLVDAIAQMDQQRGGDVQGRGAGEKRISEMRSRLRKRTTVLQKRIDAVAGKDDKMRLRRRERSARSGRRLPVIALVGYTNAGKSLLHARLAGGAGDEARAQDALFASLDTSTSTARLTDGSDALVVDTVGFIRNLSHGLVSCFHATLQEALLCDLIVLVVDASDPRGEAQRQTVLSTLRELETPEALLDARIEVHTKSDKLDVEAVERWRRRYGDMAPAEEGKDEGKQEHNGNVDYLGSAEEHEDASEHAQRPFFVLASARSGEGMDVLGEAIHSRLARRTGRSSRTIELPVSGSETGEQISYLHSHPRVTVTDTSVSEDGEVMLITVEADADAMNAFVGRWGQEKRRKSKGRRRF